MIDVHLIGYTADLRHIVLDLEPDQRRGRYRLEIDLDLFLTLDEVRERRRAAGMEAGPQVGVGGEVEEADAPAVVEVSDNAEQDRVGDERAERIEDAPARPATEVEPGSLEEGRGRDRPEQRTPQMDIATTSADDPSASRGGEIGVPPVPDPELPAAQPASKLEGAPPGAPTAPTPPPESRLSPAEIQALLRAGRSLRTVAKLAGIDVQRVERWLSPILAERTQVIQEALATPLGSAAGNSPQPLIAAVTRNLSARGTDLEHISWTAIRRGDGRWTLQLRYRDDDRVRCASWSFDRRHHILTAGSALAQELGWTDDQSDHEEDEPTSPRRDADALVEASLAGDAAPPPGPPAGASGPPGSGPPAGASGPPRAGQDGEATSQPSYEQQESSGREEGRESEPGPDSDPVL